MVPKPAYLGDAVRCWSRLHVIVVKLPVVAATAGV